jgi:hypothetical protein
MAFNLKLPRLLASMRWKVKIRDKERVEDPHVTIIHKTEVWRVCLRDGRFMDGGSWKDMPDGLEEVVRANWGRLRAAWDRMYPNNPVQGNDGDNDDNA